MASKNNEQGDLNDIVISGISGIFPDSDNVDEFKTNLFAGIDMVSSFDRSNKKAKNGLLKTIDRFDHSFFRLTHAQGDFSNIPTRILLEKTFEAVIDSGYNPQHLKGKEIAVICGIWDSSIHGDPVWRKHSDEFSANLNRCQFMMANRISYCLDVKGPSFPVNTACSSSAYALNNAIQYIRGGHCEGAIVSGANFCFPGTEYLYGNNILSQDKCAPFDAEANGYIRAESAVSIFLQKRKDARRVYANIIGSKITFEGFKKEGAFHPSIDEQKRMYELFYQDIYIDPQNVSYIETHGTGTQVGDFVEGTSIEKFFCENRDTPLKIGSVKSNMGHSEAAALLCSIVKMIISFECGIIPPNLHYKNPNPNIPGLQNGRLEVITKPTPLEGKYFAINSFGVGGANSHTLLTPNDKVKNTNGSEKGIPKLVTISGRTEEAVETILNDLEKNFSNTEYIGLMHEIFCDDIKGHPFRGYIVLNENKTNKKSKKFYSGERRPIWFVFSGMGSQWPTMGKSLMDIPIFAKSIHKSHQLLESKGIDLVKVITNDDPKIFENILNSFIGIAAIQIALVDILTALDIRPDGIIGHSVGELGCAYADGCLTAEQTLLVAYYRGLVSIESELICGTMAAVGISYETLKDLTPPEIDIACHNSPFNCTVSGPTEPMLNFIEELKKDKIFVREVDTSNIAYHSRYIATLGPKYISFLKKIITEPKLRSAKWICTSALEKNWDKNEVKYCSAEYHTNNLISPVYFEESCRHIPNDVIAIEVAPNGLLNAILKHSLVSSIDNIPLMKKQHVNNVEYLLNALGCIYEVGGNLKLANLYPVIEFPVSRSTPMISSLIKWQHEEQWEVGKANSDICQSTEQNFVINSNTEEYAFMKDHVIDGKNLYPGFGYLWLVLETLATIKKKKVYDIPVVFENVRFEKVLNIINKGALCMHVSVQLETGYFEVLESNSAVATGNVRVLKNTNKEVDIATPFKLELSKCDTFALKKKDFYKEMRIRGYFYGEKFRNIVHVDFEEMRGEISWRDNFITFMDSMAQILLLFLDCRELIVPTFVKKITIDFNRHFEILENLDKKEPSRYQDFPVIFDPNCNLLYSGGVQMTVWKGKEINRQKDQADPVLEKYEFVPYICNEVTDVDLTVRLCIHVGMQNLIKCNKVKTYELLDQNCNLYCEVPIISIAILNTLKNCTLVEADVNVISESKSKTESLSAAEITGITILSGELPNDRSSSFIIISDILSKMDKIESIFSTLIEGGFIITKETSADENVFQNLGLCVCFSRPINASENIFLLSKSIEKPSVTRAVQIKNDSFCWISKIQKALTYIQPKRNEKLVIFAEKEPLSGILGIFLSLRKEDKGNSVRCFFMMDSNSPNFTLEDKFYELQFNKNLSQNVYKNGQWGCYCHLPLEPVEDIDAVHAFCSLEERGNLSTFRWIEGSLNPNEFKITNGKSLVHVYYSSLNFHDIMLAVRKISTIDLPCYSRLLESHEGIEFSGKGQNGERLMGILKYKGIATIAETVSTLTWNVPDKMTLEEAATIPVVYATVIYALFFKINLKRGSTVLIHAGSGGIGQAAINICLHYQCEIFTTVGTPEKVKFIRKTFPQISENHIGNSRDTSFKEMILKETRGKGVNIVLNSLAGDKLAASVECVAEGGHFLEIGKFDMAKNNLLELGHFLNNISFHSVQLDILLWKKIEEMEVIHKKMQEMINQGIVKPLKRTVFAADEVEFAFRYMAGGKHIGKVVIKIRDEEDEFKDKVTPICMKAKPQVLCHGNKSYLIIGGLGGFGLELADWLILRGAQNIVLSSRTGVKNGYQSYRLKIWQSYGINVVISTEDVTTEAGVRNLLQTANSLGPVAGIFNLALILKNAPFLEQTEDMFHTVVGPKAMATIYLDKLSRTMCPYLEHFVMFSSVVTGQGNSTQTNYAFANSIMERICETRKTNNLPALAIQWGAIGDVGFVADFSEDNIRIAVCGALQQRIQSCLECLNLFMKQQNPIVSSMIVADKCHIGLDIANTMANILGFKDLKTINQTWTLPELGMDSIVALELQQVLELEFNVHLTHRDLQNMTFAELNLLKERNENIIEHDEKTTSLRRLKSKDSMKQPIVCIPFDENELEIFKNKNRAVFIFPGIEGTAQGMEQLVCNLNIKAFCLQYYGDDTAELSFQDMCKYYTQIILEKIDSEEELDIIGYSFGGLFAIEVTNMLEKNGKNVHILLIESSPLWADKLLKNISKKKAYCFEESLQNDVFGIFMHIMRPKTTKDEYIRQLESVGGNWAAKKQLCLSLFSSKLINENELFGTLLDQICNMAKKIPSCQVSRVKLKASCALIRCIEGLCDLEDEALGLTEYFENTVQVHQLDVDHFSIPSHPKTAEIIMKYWTQLTK